MLLIIAQIIAGFVYANFVEWAWHRFVFHGLGKKKSSVFSSHWKDHHRTVRKSKGYDLKYHLHPLDKRGSRAEALELVLGALIHTPLLFVFPVFSIYLWFHAFAYFLIHRKSHLDPEWAKKYVRWHWDHHMGKNQDANWCVTFPFWDYILGTRLYFHPRDDYNKHTTQL